MISFNQSGGPVENQFQKLLTELNSNRDKDAREIVDSFA
jgi:hypothetical protein